MLQKVKWLKEWLSRAYPNALHIALFVASAARNLKTWSDDCGSSRGSVNVPSLKLSDPPRW